MLCSRRNIISYCSMECQAKDWPYHKKHCQAMAVNGRASKDKDKISEIAKKFEEGSQGNRLHDWKFF